MQEFTTNTRQLTAWCIDGSQINTSEDEEYFYLINNGKKLSSDITVLTEWDTVISRVCSGTCYIYLGGALYKLMSYHVIKMEFEFLKTYTTTNLRLL